MDIIPLISILIPAYNHDSFISETIHSIINQDYENLELIVIDDGSQDTTWDILQSIEPTCKDRFVRTLFKRQSNKGTCTTLNRLLDEAEGEYVCIVASDDCMAPHACTSMASFLTSHPDYILAVGDNEIIDSQSKKIYWDKNRNAVYERNHAVFYTFADFLKKSIQIPFDDNHFGKYPYLFCQNHIPNGYMIRKNFFDLVRFTAQAPLEDWYLMLQIAKYGRFKFIEDILFYYRWHGTNTVKNKQKMKEISQKTKMYEREILKNINPREVLPEVNDFIKNGIEYKRKGIHNIFEIVKIATVNHTIFDIRIFSKSLFKLKR